MEGQKLYINNLRTILLCSVVGGIIISYLTCPSCVKSIHGFIFDCLFSTSIWFTLWAGNTALVQFLDKRISWTAKPIKRVLIGVLVSLVYSTVSVLLLLLIFRPLLSFDVGDKIVKQVVLVSLLITLVMSLIMHSRAFLINWKVSLINAEKFKRESVAAKYESLKSQVNPHFLFNSLNALTNLVYEDQDKAAKFIKQLSEVYRYVLDTREKEVVVVSEELKFLQSYIFLQEIRFGNNLKIDVAIENQTFQVAPLALQLLIENAIKHNVISADDPLQIRVYVSDEYLIVENDVQLKLSITESSSGFGLENIKRRYSFLSDNAVIVESTADKFIVKLPIVKVDKV
jgi:sensor histidine kinase YesM